MFEYAFARGYCEHYGLELHTDPWIGEAIFELSHPRCENDLPRRDENSIVLGEDDVSYRSYSQRQYCADFYSLTQIREWFKFRPSVAEPLIDLWKPRDEWALAHVRRGDYVGRNSPYPLVSRASYERACVDYGIPVESLHWVEEEKPATHVSCGGELGLLPDFWRMTQAKTLLRANSSFSFWAAAIAQANHGARVLSPLVDDLAGGVEYDVSFIEGNGARIADIAFVEPITIKP